MADTPRTVALVGHRLAAPSPTGIGRYYTEIATGLAAGADPAQLRYRVASTREPSPPAWVVPPLELGSLGGPRKLRAVAWGVLGRPRVDRALGRPDLVHLLHPWAAVPTAAPLVATVHDLMPLLQPQWYGRLESWSFRRGIERVRDDAALVIADSQHTADLLEREAGIEPARVRVVWIGVGDEFRRRPSSTEMAETCARHRVEPGRFLMAIGAVNERKNLGVVLRALARTDLTALGSVALLVAGPTGRGAAAVVDEARRLGVTDRVRFAGFVDGTDLPVLLGASLALVHPSRDEGFGITPLEAMAAGAPALASRAGSLPEVVGEAGVLLAPDDPDAWAGAITALATDPRRRTPLIDAGTAHQARFTWARTADETRAIHTEVLDR